jgi:hypothetical protein
MELIESPDETKYQTWLAERKARREEKRRIRQEQQVGVETAAVHAPDPRKFGEAALHHAATETTVQAAERAAAFLAEMDALLESVAV